MLKLKTARTMTSLALAVALAPASTAFADDATDARIEALEKQVQMLKEMLLEQQSTIQVTTERLDVDEKQIATNRASADEAHVASSGTKLSCSNSDLI